MTDATEDPAAFCFECNKPRKPQEIRTKRLQGEPQEDGDSRSGIHTMCIYCWRAIFSDIKVYGDRSKGTSVSHTLYCPTCGNGWTKEALNALLPRECYKCRNGGRSLSSEGELLRSNFEAASRERELLRNQYLGCRDRHHLLTSRVYERTGLEHRDLSVVQPMRDLVTDFKMVENMMYLKKGAARLWDADAPRPRGKHRK